jgi:hypothetical protein
MDAARLLPFVGAFLFAIPVLWSKGVDPGAETAREAVYIFAVWALLILGTFGLSRRLALRVDAAEPRAAETGAAEPGAAGTEGRAEGPAPARRGHGAARDGA